MWTSKYKMWIDFEMRQKGVLKHRIIDIESSTTISTHIGLKWNYLD